MIEDIWTIVPIRGIERGKSRLAAVLDAASRERPQARGWTTSVCTQPELGFDLDTPDDLAAWSSRRRGGAPGPDAGIDLPVPGEFAG